jgi:hypothetical protein
MIRASTIALVGLVLGAGLVTYQMKHRVAKLDQELVRVQRETLVEQERQHVLDAEWSLLNEPERLRRLAERHLPLAPMQPRQFSDLGDAVRRLPAAAPEAPPAPAPAAAPSPAPVAGEGRGEGAPAAAPPAAPAARPPARQLETRLVPPGNVRPAAASITQETLAPPPGIAARPGSAAPRPAPTPAPAAAPAARPALATTPLPAPVARPAAPPAIGSALGGGTSLPPPVPWTPPPR